MPMRWVFRLSSLDRRSQLLGLLGDLPPRSRAPESMLRSSAARGTANVEAWLLDLNGRESVPALLALPRAQPPRIVVLYCHAHGNRFDIGKDELITGRPAIAAPYGEALTGLGCAALAIDHWGFGERATVSERLLNKRFLWHGSTLWGMRVADMLGAFDWLRAQSRFTDIPVIALGLSMGGTMAIWCSALEPGIAACVDLCCLAEFDSLTTSGADDLHAEYLFVPAVRKHFTAAAISALIAPRPHLSCAGSDDPLTPVDGLKAIDHALRAAYADVGAPDAWLQRIFAAGHVETHEMRQAVLDFIVRCAEGGRR
jgi:dienelactone hydrolase